MLTRDTGEMGKLLLLLYASTALAADLGPDLLAAAKKGQTAAVESLVGRGASVDSRDKQGRTAIMLAAEHGHPDTVKLLLDKGAKADARDRQGWTAWGLAYLSSESERARVLDLLPAVPHARVSLDAKWGLDNLYSSCSLSPQQLAQHVAGLEPDALVTAALREASTLSAHRLVEFVDGGTDAALTVRVRPGASCLAQQSADQLSMALDIKFERGQSALVEKTFGGGLKGLHVRTVRSPAQYQPLYADWAKAHAAQIYDAVLEAWLRSGA